MKYHDDGCVWLKTECIHPSYKCSECPVTDIWCDTMDDCLEEVRESAYQEGYNEAMELLSGTSVAYSFLNDEKHKAYQQGVSDTIQQGRAYSDNFFESMIKMSNEAMEKLGTNSAKRHELGMKVLALRDCYTMFNEVWIELGVHEDE